MYKKFLPCGFVLIFSFWTWKIFSLNILLGFIVLITSICLWLSIISKSKYYSYLFIFLFVILLFLQWQTTQTTSLTYLDNDEQRIQQMRVNEYPPLHVRIGEKTIWISLANWFELRKESIAFSRIEKNFSQVVDPNLYFFANHPRERVGIKEFEKFPYIFIPFFLVGIFSLIKNRSTGFLKISKLILIASLTLPIILISLIGHKNPFGSFTLFPFLTIAISFGVERIYQEISKLPRFPKIVTLVCILILFVFVFLQMIAYAKY